MSFNIRRIVLGCVAFTGIAACLYSRPSPSQARKGFIDTESLINKFLAGPPLTGKSVKDITDSTKWPLQGKLKVNLMYAHEALQHTNEVLPEGAVNYQEDLHGISIEACIKMENMRQETDQEVHQIVMHTLHPQHNSDNIHEVVARIAKKHKIGNCGEQSSVAYIYLKYEKNLRKVESLCLVHGDHGFVVIGRDPMSDVADPATWGRAAVVCDPWGKRYFPAEQIFEQFNKLSQRTIYDPNVHTIGWTPFGDIPLEVSIYQRLYFHQHPNKKKFAESIITACSDKDTISNKILKSCLVDYIERKAKPKVPPLLSESDRQKVELEWSRYLHKKMEEMTTKQGVHDE